MRCEKQVRDSAAFLLVLFGAILQIQGIVPALEQIGQAGSEKRSAAVGEAETIIEAGVQEFVRCLDTRQTVPLIHALQAQAETWRAAELARARKLEGGAEFAGALSYELLIPLAKDNLTLGLPVVVDSPAGYRVFQDQVEELARQVRVESRLVECITTDEAQWQQRIERRGETLPEHRTRDWEAVQQARARFERLTGPRWHARGP